MKVISHLSIQPVKVAWVLHEEQRLLLDMLNKLNISYSQKRIDLLARHVYLNSKYQLSSLIKIPFLPWQNYYFDYFHGGYSYPDKAFTKILNNLRVIRKNIARIRVSCKLYKDLLINNSIDSDKIDIIPIPVETSMFHPISCDLKNSLRQFYGIPQSSFLIGSFQKDGNYWDGSISPKLIKGPDILCETLSRLNNIIPNLHVLLSGPSRQYVVMRLRENNIKYTYLDFLPYKDLPRLYQMLDCYLITSREEGGPKAFLESFASNIPVVSTNVGQVTDLAKNDSNSFITDSFSTHELVQTIADKVYNKDLTSLLINSYHCAQAHNPDSQLSLWRDFFRK